MSTTEPSSRVALLQARLEESIEITQLLLQDQALAAIVVDVVEVVVNAVQNGGKLLLCGNGGSAADAQHLAAELIGRFCLERDAFPAIALADNVAALTAIGNDYSYAEAFARAVRGLGRPGDVLIGLSTSGCSENIVAALAAGREKGLVTVAFVGAPGSPVGDTADYCVCVPGSRTAGIQEAHMVLGHVIFECVERELCAS